MTESESELDPAALNVIERNGRLILDDQAHELEDKIAKDLELTAKSVDEVPATAEEPSVLSGASNGGVARRIRKPCSPIGVLNVLSTVPTRKGNVAPGHSKTPSSSTMVIKRPGTSHVWAVCSVTKKTSHKKKSPEKRRSKEAARAKPSSQEKKHDLEDSKSEKTAKHSRTESQSDSFEMESEPKPKKEVHKESFKEEESKKPDATAEMAVEMLSQVGISEEEPRRFHSSSHGGIFGPAKSPSPEELRIRAMQEEMAKMKQTIEELMKRNADQGLHSSTSSVSSASVRPVVVLAQSATPPMLKEIEDVALHEWATKLDLYMLAFAAGMNPHTGSRRSFSRRKEGDKESEEEDSGNQDVSELSESPEHPGKYWGIKSTKGAFPPCVYCGMSNHPAPCCLRKDGGASKPFGTHNVPLTKEEISKYWAELRAMYKKAPEQMSPMHVIMSLVFPSFVSQDSLDNPSSFVHGA
ncbi:hypothetical protein ADUPG1_013242 [Aduncisulcus paluster]|uniref:Uncharacterized protein n=1 Tax=Aduncisulcus paluster TaxID=2918883 RepID=A0ABQ5K295_9EUKA|nr:hypothetical protein ADUPG1_013242 [Aduncisulcus paluster]